MAGRRVWTWGWPSVYTQTQRRWGLCGGDLTACRTWAGTAEGRFPHTKLNDWQHQSEDSELQKNEDLITGSLGSFSTITAFTPESLLSSDLLKTGGFTRLVWALQNPPECHMLTGMPSWPTFSQDYFDCLWWPSFTPIGPSPFKKQNEASQGNFTA